MAHQYLLFAVLNRCSRVLYYRRGWNAECNAVLFLTPSRFLETTCRQLQRCWPLHYFIRTL